MINQFKIVLAVVVCAIAATAAYGAGSSYPSVVLKNQFGETSINSILGGSNQIDCNFVVDSSNGNGLGIRSLKGAGCAAVYMHTSATPAAGNPNPAAGYILVQLASNYGGYVGGYSGFVQPLSGAPIVLASPSPGISPGQPYVIVSPAGSSLAEWQSVGLPAGLTPAVGQAFVGASPSPSPSGSGAVEIPAVAGSGVTHIEVIGDANQAVSATGGAQILMAVMSGSPQVATAPANNTVVGLRFVMLPLASQLK